MPRRPRPSYRASPGQGRKSHHPAPPAFAAKAQLHQPKPNISKDAGSSFFDKFKEGSREDDKPGTWNALKRRREEEDVGEDEEEEEEEDAETDIDVDADTPRVVQWLDDEDILSNRSWKDKLKQKVPDEVCLGLLSRLFIC